MFRWLRAWLSKFSGFFGEKADNMQTDKHVIGATYDKSIALKKERRETVKRAVAQIMGIEEDKKTKLIELNKRLEHLETVKAGAKGMLQQLINRLRAENPEISSEEIKRHAEYIEHSTAFNDASSTVSEIEERIEGLEKDLDEHQVQLSQYKAELQQMQREYKKLEEEKHEALADVAIAKELEAVNEDLNGVAQDTTDRDLRAAREARKNLKNRAKVSAQLAGTDAKSQESAYLQFAQSTKNDSQLDSLLDFGEPKDTGDKDAALLPE